MTSIFPIDAQLPAMAGNSGLSNVYLPNNCFKFTNGTYTALPDLCPSMLSNQQMNGIVSEFISFAECLNPCGVWDLNSNQNLCSNFSWWMNNSLRAAAAPGIVVSPVAPVATSNYPLVWKDTLTGNVYYYKDASSSVLIEEPPKTPLQQVTDICADAPAKAALISCVGSKTPLQQVTDICADAPAKAALISCVGSSTPLQQVTDICADNAAGDALASCLISGDANNSLVAGTDGRLFVPAAAGGGGISSDAQQALSLGSDSLPFTAKQYVINSNQSFPDAGLTLASAPASMSVTVINPSPLLPMKIMIISTWSCFFWIVNTNQSWVRQKVLVNGATYVPLTNNTLGGTSGGYNMGNNGGSPSPGLVDASMGPSIYTDTLAPGASLTYAVEISVQHVVGSVPGDNYAVESRQIAVFGANTN